MYSIKFATNDKIKSLFKAEDHLSFWQLTFSGTLAGLSQISLTYPLEVVRTRLSLSASWGVKYKGILHCLFSMAKVEGVTSLYKGFGPCV